MKLWTMYSKKTQFCIIKYFSTLHFAFWINFRTYALKIKRYRNED